MARARQNPSINPEIEELIRAGMARSLWVNAYASYADENPGEFRDRGFPRAGAGQDWDDVAPETPEAAELAAKDLVVLYHQAEGLPKNTTDETMTLLFQVAAEADTGRPLSHDVEAFYATQAERRAAGNRDAKGESTVGDVAREFGWEMANAATSSGASWFDDHREKNERGLTFTIPRVTFECLFDGEMLDWSGHVQTPDAPAISGRKAYGTVRGPRIVTTFEVITEESAAEGDVAERGVADETSMEPSEEEALLGWTVVDKAMEFFADDDHAVAETSSSSFHKGLWYIGEAVENYQTGEERTERYHLHGFTAEQEEQVCNRWRNEEWLPQPRQIGRITVVNPTDVGSLYDTVYVWQFASGFDSGTWLMVYADDEETALEMAVEWLAKHAPGRLADAAVKEEFDRLVKEHVEQHGQQPEDEELWELQDEAAVDTTSVGEGNGEPHYLNADEYSLVATDPSDAELLDLGEAHEMAEDRQRQAEFDARMAHLRTPRIWRNIVPADYAAVPYPPITSREEGTSGEAVDFQPSRAVERAVQFLAEHAPLEARWNTGGPATSFEARTFYLSPIVGDSRTTFLLENFTIDQQKEIWDRLHDQRGVMVHPGSVPRRNPARATGKPARTRYAKR